MRNFVEVGRGTSFAVATRLRAKWPALHCQMPAGRVGEMGSGEQTPESRLSLACEAVRTASHSGSA